MTRRIRFRRGPARGGPAREKAQREEAKKDEDEDKVPEYVLTKYERIECGAVWKSHRTPSTRCCLRSCVCSMSWSFQAIDATLSP